jgi:hypothetical protein
MTRSQIKSGENVDDIVVAMVTMNNTLNVFGLEVEMIKDERIVGWIYTFIVVLLSEMTCRPLRTVCSYLAVLLFTNRHRYLYIMPTWIRRFGMDPTNPSPGSLGGLFAIS